MRRRSGNNVAGSRMNSAFGVRSNEDQWTNDTVDAAYENKKRGQDIEMADMKMAAARRQSANEEAQFKQQDYINNNYDAIAADIKTFDPEADDFDDRMANLPIGSRDSPLLKGKMDSLIRSREQHNSRMGSIATARKSEFTDFLNKGGGQFLSPEQRDYANMMRQNGASVDDVYNQFGDDITMGSTNVSVKAAHKAADEATKGDMGFAKGNLDYARSVNKKHADDVMSLQNKKENDDHDYDVFFENNKVKNKAGDYVLPKGKEYPRKWDAEDKSELERVTRLADATKGAIKPAEDIYLKSNAARGDVLNSSLKIAREEHLPKLNGNFNRKTQALSEQLQGAGTEAEKKALIQKAAIDGDGAFKTAMSLHGEAVQHTDTLGGAKQTPMTLKARMAFYKNPSAPVFYDRENKEFILNPFLDLTEQDKQSAIKEQSFANKYANLRSGKPTQDREALENRLISQKLPADDGMIEAIRAGYSGVALSAEDAAIPERAAAHKAAMDKFNKKGGSAAVPYDDALAGFSSRMDDLSLTYPKKTSTGRNYSDPKELDSWATELSELGDDEARLEMKEAVKAQFAVKDSKGDYTTDGLDEQAGKDLLQLYIDLRGAKLANTKGPSTAHEDLINLDFR